MGQTKVEKQISTLIIDEANERIREKMRILEGERGLEKEGETDRQTEPAEIIGLD